MGIQLLFTIISILGIILTTALTIKATIRAKDFVDLECLAVATDNMNKNFDKNAKESKITPYEVSVSDYTKEVLETIQQAMIIKLPVKKILELSWRSYVPVVYSFLLTILSIVLGLIF